MPFPALRPDTLRAIVAVSGDGELAVALRDVLPRAHVVVHDSRPDEARAVFDLCLPYPWMLVSDAASAATVIASTDLGAHPTILLFRHAPAGAPSHALEWNGFASLAARIRRMLDATCGGMRLAPGLGVELPGGDVVRSASLQALVSMHPAGFALGAQHFRSAARILTSRGVAWRPVRDAAAGGVVLARSSHEKEAVA